MLRAQSWCGLLDNFGYNLAYYGKHDLRNRSTGNVCCSNPQLQKWNKLQLKPLKVDLALAVSELYYHAC